MMNDAEFLSAWEALSSFGAVKGTLGVDREAATEADGQQRKWFESLLAEHGFKVVRDEIGNQFALYEFHEGAPYVLTGSHLDSQPTAGRFDGAYGVLASAAAAIRCVEHLQSSPEKARYNLAVVNWFNEEGSRFKPSLMGSSVYTGKLELSEALATTDVTGVTVQQALDAIDERGSFDGLEVVGYAEIHVQQGRSMEEQGVKIGLVHATWGAHKFEMKFVGEQAHSGSTLMEDRKDALLGASHMIVEAREITRKFVPGALHTAVGEIQVYPNSPVVVASEATILLDLRSPSTEVLDTAAAMLMQKAEQIRAEVGVEVYIVAEHSWEQNPYQPEGVELARRIATELQLTNAPVMTVAGHDSTNMKDIAPTVMLFVPSVDGISHNLAEFTSDDDMLDGVRVMTEVMKHLIVGALG